MASAHYATECHYKNDLYRLSIINSSTDLDSSSQTSDQSIGTDQFPEQIKPTVTQINFELIDPHQKVSVLPEVIRLQQLLNVVHIKSVTNRQRRQTHVTNDVDAIHNNAPLDPPLGQSQETLYTMLSRSRSELNVNQSGAMRREISLAGFPSNQGNPNAFENQTRRSIVRLSYIDVSNSTHWTIKKIEVELETEKMAVDLYRTLNHCLSTLTGRPRYLLVFVNPCCGKGRARYVYEKKIRPIFHRASIRVDTIYTERANHARDYIINEDLNGYDGLVCVGGDGMFAELCHGLLSRTSSEAGLDINDRKVNLVRPDIKIGVIPAGSTDAVVFGTTGLNDPVTSALQIITGESLSIDIATIHNENGFVRFMAAMMAYGYFGDIIEQSDKWRCLGPLRYDVSGVLNFIRSKSYRTDVTMTLTQTQPSSTSRAKKSSLVERVSSCSHHDNGTSDPVELKCPKHPIDSLVKTTKSMILPALAFCSKNCETCALQEPTDREETFTSSKMTREGRYAAINCLNMPCRCAKSRLGMSPFVHLGDGSFDLLLIKRSWRAGFLRFLWRVANDSRSIEDLPNVERYRVNEVLIRPKYTETDKLGHWACDGELINGQEIQIRVHRQALNLFAAGITVGKLEEHRPAKKMANSKSGFRLGTKRRG